LMLTFQVVIQCAGSDSRSGLLTSVNLAQLERCTRISKKLTLPY
jgi:hypothetical protein